MRTWTGKAEGIEREWFVVDAEGETLGRLASRIAPILRGKHKPTYTLTWTVVTLWWWSMPKRCA